MLSLVEICSKSKRFGGSSGVFIAFADSLSGLIVKAYVFAIGVILDSGKWSHR